MCIIPIYSDLIDSLGAEVVDNKFYIDQAIRHDNADLLMHVPLREVMESLNAKDLLGAVCTIFLFSTWHGSKKRKESLLFSENLKLLCLALQ